MSSPSTTTVSGSSLPNSLHGETTSHLKAFRRIGRVSASPEAANDTSRSYICSFCQRRFKRSDTRRVHYSRCRARISAGSVVPPTLRKGRKLRACDPCAKRKRACDNAFPCSQCVSGDLECSKNRMVARTSSIKKAALPSENLNTLAAPDENQVEIEASIGINKEGCSSNGYTGFRKHADRYKSRSDPRHLAAEASYIIPRSLSPAFPRPCSGAFNFLLNFTRSRSIAPAFNFTFSNSRHKSQRGNTHLSDSLPANYVYSGSGSGSPPLCFGYNGEVYDIDSQNTDLAFNPDSFWSKGEFALSESSYSTVTNLQGNSEGWTSYEQNELAHCLPATGPFNGVDDPILLRSREIWLHLQSLSAHKYLANLVGSTEQATDHAWSTRCLYFFSPFNLRRFVNIFWDDWYPHCPIIHRPSFEISSVPCALLITMVLIGASLSPHRDDIESAREWFDQAEELAFQELSTQQDIDEADKHNSYSKIAKPSSLQALILICCLQNWEGSNQARTRIRRKRYSGLVEVARRMGFGNATHEGGKAWAGNGESFEWAHFIVAEEVIRTFSYIYLVDTSFVIFNNSPPKLLLQEMTLDLISPAACFEAETPSKCLIELQRTCPAGTFRSKLSFLKTVRILQQNSFNEEGFAALLQLDSLNLFCILAALYTPIFQQQTNLGASGLHSYFQTSLDTWQLVWNSRSDIPFLQSLESEPTVESWKRVGFFQHANEWNSFSTRVLELLEVQSREADDLAALGFSSSTLFPKIDESSTDQVAILLSSLQVTGFAQAP